MQLVNPSVEEPGRDIFRAYTPINPPPYGNKLMASGQYFGPYGSGNSTINPIQFRVYYIPLIIPYPLLINEFMIDIITQDNDSQAKLGIFAIERGKIGKNIYVNTIGLNTTGKRVVPANVSVGAGSYAFIFMTESTIVVVRKSNLTLGLLGFSAGTEIEDNAYAYNTLAGFDSDLEDDPVTTLSESTSVPRVMARMG